MKNKICKKKLVKKEKNRIFKKKLEKIIRQLYQRDIPFQMPKQQLTYHLLHMQMYNMDIL